MAVGMLAGPSTNVDCTVVQIATSSENQRPELVIFERCYLSLTDVFGRVDSMVDGNAGDIIIQDATIVRATTRRKVARSEVCAPVT